MPPEKVHPSIFKGANRKFQKPKAHLLAIDRHNKVKSEKELEKREKKLEKRTKRKLNKLADMGINYSIDINKVCIVHPPPPSPTTTTTTIRVTSLQ
jgi:nucleolar protein 15